ncbi:peptidase [Citrobacter sp. DNRA3]|uniref:DNZ54_00345 family protein n=1 Tax=Citrobacter sp. DNRA3 TaxID=2723054 RepID=UPI0014599042|nr:DNZ54_00345 family protein [Citrobacter sp. DNRA3]NBJ29603.1 peptidase [Citrobacter freundii]NMD76491.1 peptidase [Citrobacter sp. DNRA3]
MKKKIMNALFQLLWVVLLVAGLLYPRSGAPVLVAALIWVSCFLAWLLAVFCAVGWFAGERARAEVRAALHKFKSHPLKPVRTWTTRLLIVACLALSGWVVTLVFYLLTLVLYQITRAQSHDPAAA